MDKERSLQFMFWFTILFIVAAVGACQLGSLPVNLEKLALSDQALVRLQEAQPCSK